MMKRLVLLSICFFSFFVKAQNPASFYIDSVVTKEYGAEFTNNAIYFFTSKYFAKTDYQGNIIWKKQVTDTLYAYRMRAYDDAIYGFSGADVFKIDTGGNIVWVKNFSDRVYTGVSYSGYFGDIVCDGSRIYLSESQDTSTQSGFSSSYRGVLVLDTAGNLLNVNYNPLSITYDQSVDFCLTPCIHSLKAGAWLGYVVNPSQTDYDYSYLIRVNNNGDYDYTANSPNFTYGPFSYIELQRIITMPDSTYLVLNNVTSTPGPPDPLDLFYLSKIDEKGNIIWQYAYWDSTYTGMMQQYQQAYDVTCDSSNNIYLTGWAEQQGAYNGTFGMKLDNSGNILFTKFWHGSQANVSLGGGSVNPKWGASYNNTLHYSNGHLYCIAGYNYYDGLLVFDTLFSHSCYDSDSTISIYRFSSNPWTTSVTDSTVAVVYNSPNDTLTLHSINLASHNLCTALEVKNILPSNQSALLYPNPLTSSSTLQLNTQLKNAEVVIFDMLGKEMLRKKLTGDRMEIEKGSLESGVYFVKVISEERQWVGKLVVE